MTIRCEGGPAAGVRDVQDRVGDRFGYESRGLRHRYLRTNREDSAGRPIFAWDPWTDEEGRQSGVHRKAYLESCRPPRQVVEEA